MENYKGSKLMIVDDEYANIFLLKKILEEEGYITSSASNGKEALEKIPEVMPDLILLDIMMPEISGYDVLQEVMENENINHIPVIMVTAKTGSEDIEKTLNMGAIEYIRKPIDEIELLARVRTALRIKKNEEQLKEMVYAKEEFIRIVAHDLRTPFSTISGFADLMLEDENLKKSLGEENKQFLEFILNSSSFLIEYFNKLLDWSKLGLENLKLNKQLFRINSIIESLLLVYKFKIDNKQLNIINNISNEEMVSADEVYFGQAINNIFSNCIKFTMVGGIIEFNMESTNNNKRICIKDNGVGMNDDVVQKIFSNQNIKSTRGTEGEKGSGLGFKICKRILDSHGFILKIESKIGGGTKFIIEINSM